MKSLVSSLALAAAFAAGRRSASAAPVPCVNGFAGAYPCDKVDMLARVPLTQMGGTASDTGGDVWGWTDRDHEQGVRAHRAEQRHGLRRHDRSR